MASLADMLVSSTAAATQGISEQGGAQALNAGFKSGIEIAQQVENAQAQRATLEEKKSALQQQKIEKYVGMYDTLGKLKGSAKSQFAKVVMPKAKLAMGLQDIFNEDSEMLMKDHPEVVGYLGSLIEEGKFTFPQLAEKAQDAQWVADNIPLAQQWLAQKDFSLSETVSGGAEELQASNAKRIADTTAKERALIATQAVTNNQLQARMDAGQVEVSKEVAKEYASYQAVGGKASMDASLNKLEEAKRALDTGKIKTGGISTFIPGFNSDLAQSMIDPKMAAMKTSVQSALNAVLRQTLGSAFTAEEGTRVLNQIWDDKQSPAENAKRLDAKIRELRQNVRMKEAAFESQGFAVKSGKAPKAEVPVNAGALNLGGVEYDKAALKAKFDADPDAINRFAKSRGVSVSDVKKMMGK